MTRTKEIILLLLIVLLTISLVIVSSSTKGILIFKNLSEVINKQIIYQSITLLGTFFFLFVLWMTKKKELKTYFQKGNISAEIIPEPIIGIKPKPNENWFHIGINFSIIVSVVTAIVIYFQIISENGISLRDILKVLPFSVVFALSNAFVEESITRLGVVVVLKDIIKDKTIPLISAGIFGVAHYWGNPDGLLGILAAVFLGWVLSKSILETKGIFWAWLIHFQQDVIIFSVILTMK
jgi:hypothetical protein